MGSVCSAINCPNSYYVNITKVKLFPLPEDVILRRIWLRVCGRPVDWQPEITPKLCEMHFLEYQYVMNSEGKKYLNPIAIPRTFDYTTSDEAFEYLMNKFLVKTVYNFFLCARDIGSENYNINFGNIIITPTMNPEQTAEMERTRQLRNELVQEINDYATWMEERRDEIQPEKSSIYYEMILKTPNMNNEQIAEMKRNVRVKMEPLQQRLEAFETWKQQKRENKPPTENSSENQDVLENVINTPNMKSEKIAEMEKTKLLKKESLPQEIEVFETCKQQKRDNESSTEKPSISQDVFEMVINTPTTSKQLRPEQIDELKRESLQQAIEAFETWKQQKRPTVIIYEITNNQNCEELSLRDKCLNGATYNKLSSENSSENQDVLENVINTPIMTPEQIAEMKKKRLLKKESLQQEIEAFETWKHWFLQKRSSVIIYEITDNQNCEVLSLMDNMCLNGALYNKSPSENSSENQEVFEMILNTPNMNPEQIAEMKKIILLKKGSLQQEIVSFIEAFETWIQQKRDKSLSENSSENQDI